MNQYKPTFGKVGYVACGLQTGLHNLQLAWVRITQIIDPFKGGFST